MGARRRIALQACLPHRRLTRLGLEFMEGRRTYRCYGRWEVGLISFEVKDWELNEIQEATPRSFVLTMGHEKRSLKNPLLQAREYFESLMGRIKHGGRLLSKDGVYFGKPRVPSVCCEPMGPNLN